MSPPHAKFNIIRNFLKTMAKEQEIYMLLAKIFLQSSWNEVREHMQH